MLGVYSEALTQASEQTGAVRRMETRTDREFRKVHHALTPVCCGQWRCKIYMVQMDQIKGNCVMY